MNGYNKFETKLNKNIPDDRLVIKEANELTAKHADRFIDIDGSLFEAAIVNGFQSSKSAKYGDFIKQTDKEHNLEYRAEYNAYKPLRMEIVSEFDESEMIRYIETDYPAVEGTNFKIGIKNTPEGPVAVIGPESLGYINHDDQLSSRNVHQVLEIEQNAQTYGPRILNKVSEMLESVKDDMSASRPNNPAAVKETSAEKATKSSRGNEFEIKEVATEIEREAPNSN